MTALMVDGDFFTASALAGLLQVDVSQIYKQAKSKSDPIPHVRVAGSIRFPKTAVENWLKRNATNV